MYFNLLIVFYAAFNLLYNSFYGIKFYNDAKFTKDSTIQLFTRNNEGYRNQSHSRYLADYTLLKLDANSFRQIGSQRNKAVSLGLPYKSGSLQLELEPLYLFDGEFKLLTDKSKGQALPFKPGTFYRGKIKNDTASLVTLSVFEDEVSGIISSSRFGNLNLGRIQNQPADEYILYNESDAKEPVNFTCASPGNALYKSQLEQLQSQVEQQLESRADGCITVDFELTYEVYTQYQNNINNAANWLTTLFAAVKSLYLNEQVNISIKTIFVWTSDDGYSDDVGTALDQLKTRRLNDAAFTANFVHLVRGELCNGGCSLAGIAWLDILCDNSYRFAVSEPLFSYAVYPGYSWSVNVLTHEQGHNIASPHTHWCGWTGGAIDGCASPDGTCATGPTPPSGGGTIMSYCHQNVGINFANGFGTQPGNRIRARFNAANCLSTNCDDGITVPAGPSNCNDGIQNGSETGIDCGGSCAECVIACLSPINLSQGKTTSQSTNFDASNTYPSSRVVDGTISNSNFNHTGLELQPWLQVDLGNTFTISSIKITNRSGCSPCSGRIKRFKVFVSNSQPTAYSNSGHIYLFDNSSGLSDGQVFNIPNLSASGRYVRIWVDYTGNGNGYLHFAEVNVMGCTGEDPCLDNVQPNLPILSSMATSYPRNSSFTVTAIANDPDANIATVEFYNGPTFLGSDNSLPYSYTVDVASAGSYSITAKAVDECNESNTSTALVINTTISCSDGFQNGDEEGVDCGGSCNEDCPQGCFNPTNLSQGKVASQSTNFNASNSYPASTVVDGSTASSSFNHTGSELQPWWQVDLGAISTISSIEITHRTGCPSCAGRLKNFKVFVTNTAAAIYSSNTGVVSEYNSSGMGNGEVYNITGLNASGRYIRIWANHTSANYLHLAEVRVFGCATDPCIGNQAPTKPTLTSAQQSYPQNGSFTVSATSSDAGGISEMRFFVDGNLHSTDNSSPYSMTLSPASAASYNMTAIAVDNCNATSVSSNIFTVTTSSSCNDGVMNGNETGVDCGGSCPACDECTNPTNISQGKSASQSTNFNASNSYPASSVVDGSIASSSFNHTGAELQPWWQVDLGSNSQVISIELTHRTGCAPCAGRIKNFKIFVTSTPVNSYATAGEVYSYNSPVGIGNGEVLNIPNLNVTGRYVRIWVDNGTTNSWLHFAEVKVMGCSGVGNSNVSFTNHSDQEEKTNTKFDVRLYPNPAHDVLNFVYSYPPFEEVNASLYDLNGRQLIHSVIKEGRLDISQLESGTYFLHILYRGERKVKKILKF